jgi:hypothetical protein
VIIRRIPRRSSTAPEYHEWFEELLRVDTTPFRADPSTSYFGNDWERERRKKRGEGECVIDATGLAIRLYEQNTPGIDSPNREKSHETEKTFQ